MTRAALVFCLVAASVLVGCDRAPSDTQAAPSDESSVEGQVKASRSGGRRIRVWTDPETGCQYLLWGRSSRGSMTPRLKPDGMPLCKGVTGTPGGAGSNVSG